MAELPFIDTHVHFYDLQNEDLYYVWLQPGWKHPQLGDIEPIQAQRYWADDWVAESRFANVPKSIHVQAALGIKDLVEETRWLQAFADRLGHPHGIVAEGAPRRVGCGGGHRASHGVREHAWCSRLRARGLSRGSGLAAWLRQLGETRSGGLPGLFA